MNIILACCKISSDNHETKYGIGLDGKLPWHIPQELKLFREKTEHHILLVGSKTFDSLPILPNRTIIKLTHSENIENLIKNLREKYPDKKIFIAGGGQIYSWIFSQESLLKNAILHLSLITKEYKCDTFLDPRVYQGWEIKDQKTYEEFSHYEMVYNRYGESQYLQLLNDVLQQPSRSSRNSLVRSKFFSTMSFNLSESFPLLTTKKMFTRGVIAELLFFLRGETDTSILRNQGVKIWEGNTNREELDKNGFLDRKEWVMGPMYGYQLRNFGCEYDEKIAGPILRDKSNIDQLAKVIEMIKTDPKSRRIIMTVFNPSQAEQGVLYPCHSLMIQFYVEEGGWLDMSCYNRSQDLFLGTPFNIASSAFLLSIIAKTCNLRARMLHLMLGDCHIYTDHEESVRTQIERFPYTFPKLKINKELSTVQDIEELQPENFEILDYRFHEKLSGKMIA